MLNRKRLWVAVIGLAMCMLALPLVGADFTDTAPPLYGHGLAQGSEWVGQQFIVQGPQGGWYTLDTISFYGQVQQQEVQPTQPDQVVNVRIYTATGDMPEPGVLLGSGEVDVAGVVPCNGTSGWFAVPVGLDLQYGVPYLAVVYVSSSIGGSIVLCSNEGGASDAAMLEGTMGHWEESSFEQTLLYQINAHEQGDTVIPISTAYTNPYCLMVLVLVVLGVIVLVVYATRKRK